jgi:hypothetical protein
MAKKPEPRRSSLSAEHPYAPHEPAQSVAAAPAPQAPAPLAEATTAPAKVALTAKRPVADKSADKKPMSVRAALSDQARIRAAFMATNSAERHGSLSDFITHAALEKVAQLEKQYNNGQPWAPVDAGDVPTGRPLS